MSESLARYHATPELRFVEREGVAPFDLHTPFGGKPPMKTYRILQQMWQHEETGRTLWRDVPVSREDTRACTCHPDDKPPKPCPRKYALADCRAAAAKSSGNSSE